MRVNTYGIGNNSQTDTKKVKVLSSGADFSEILNESAKQEKTEKTEDRFVNSAAATTSYQFSGTYKDRLEQVARLNAETNWDAMSDVEKVKTFETRYQEAFASMPDVLSGLYDSYSSMHREIYDSSIKELHAYFDKDGVSPLKSEYTDNYKKAFYGDMTDDEVRTAIKEQFEGKGTLENKYNMLHEYSKCGVDRSGEFSLLSSIERQIFSKIENTHKVSLYGTGMKISEHPRFLDMFMSYAKGVGEGAHYKPSWTEIVSAAKEEYSYGGDPQVIENIKNQLDDFLDDILRR